MAFLAVILELSTPVYARVGELWTLYRQRVEERLGPVVDRARSLLSLDLRALFAANAVYGCGACDQILEIRRGALGTNVRLVDWGLGVCWEQIAMVSERIGAASFRSSNVGLSGSGVRVAVLDSGIDPRHPFLRIADSVSTCEESCDIPGRHGTFCAGVIAARHEQYSGIAPGASLLNVKVSRRDGVTNPAFLAKGIDEALDRRANVLSLSVGLNQAGHGWICVDGDCILCRAVDNAVRCGVVVVAAAGNQHRGEVKPAARTELLCPGQARESLTVGAVEKTSALKLYGPSSRGPTAYGHQKPNLVAPGVDVISTIPVLPDGEGRPSWTFFSLGSGTSVASAVVAGAVALLIERRTQAGDEWTPAEIRSELLTRYVRRLDHEPPEAVGAGCLDLSLLC